MILNQHLYRLLRHSRLSAFLQFVQQSLDGFLIKVDDYLGCWGACRARDRPCRGICRPRLVSLAPLQQAKDLACSAMCYLPHGTCRKQPARLFMRPRFLPLQYGATSVALAIYSLPLFWQSGSGLKEGSQGEVTQNYISSMRLLSNTSK